jgi:hypothetical protein
VFDANDQDYKDFLLASLRAASLRAKLMDAGLTAIGVALKGNLIGPDGALQWAQEEGLMFLIGPMPDPTQPTVELRDEITTG